ncbi:MAG: sigma factor-binding protein Crl [Vibrio sp.]
MSEMTPKITHYRLRTALKAIGPYLREGECSEQRYLFDCLAVCVNDKRPPEKREFWGWWMELTPHQQEMMACYHIGRYTQAGEWVAETLPEAACQQVNYTQVEFHKKLVKTLHERFELSVTFASASAQFA